MAVFFHKILRLTIRDVDNVQRIYSVVPQPRPLSEDHVDKIWFSVLCICI
jgi:hypothetical protein